VINIGISALLPSRQDLTGEIYEGANEAQQLIIARQIFGR
jgi:hypothetical protein